MLVMLIQPSCVFGVEDRRTFKINLHIRSIVLITHQINRPESHILLQTSDLCKVEMYWIVPYRTPSSYVPGPTVTGWSTYLVESWAHIFNHPSFRARIKGAHLMDGLILFTNLIILIVLKSKGKTADNLKLPELIFPLAPPAPPMNSP